VKKTSWADVAKDFENRCRPEVRAQREKDRRPPERKTRGLPRWKLVEVAGTLRWQLWKGRKLVGYAWTWKGRRSWQAVKNNHGMMVVDLISGTLFDCINRIRGFNPPDCLTCGACCSPWQDQDVFCDVTEQDLKRLPIAFVERHIGGLDPFSMMARALSAQYVPYAAIATKVATQRSGPFKGSQIVVCAALRGSIFGQCSCSVYEHRPKVCREQVKPGDRTCLDIRQMARNLVEDP
jgi:Fe-S-cluster containining protein